MVDARSTDENGKRWTRGAEGGVFVYLLLRVRPHLQGAKEPVCFISAVTWANPRPHQSR